VDDNPPPFSIYSTQALTILIFTKIVTKKKKPTYLGKKPMREKKVKKQAQSAFFGDEQSIYEIHVKGLIDECWSDYFSGLTVQHHADDISVLIGELRDQAALFGVLLMIRDLGIPLIKVEQQFGTQESKPGPDWVTREGISISTDTGSTK
jgi:hypothetical protein